VNRMSHCLYFFPHTNRSVFCFSSHAAGSCLGLVLYRTDDTPPWMPPRRSIRSTSWGRRDMASCMPRRFYFSGCWSMGLPRHDARTVLEDIASTLPGKTFQKKDDNTDGI
jgi:hypothetical protein